MKGNKRRNNAVYEHIFGKIKTPFENVQHSHCRRRPPKSHPHTPQKKKKNPQKKNKKNYSMMKYSDRIVVHLMITCWKERYWWKKKPLVSFNYYLALVELIIRNIYVFCGQCSKFSDGVYNYDILKRDNALKVHFFYITLLSQVILYLCNKIRCLLY